MKAEEIEKTLAFRRKQAGLASLAIRPISSAINIAARSRFSPIKSFYQNSFHRGIRDGLHSAPTPIRATPSVSSIFGPITGAMEYHAGRAAAGKVVGRATRLGVQPQQVSAAVASNPQLLNRTLSGAQRLATNQNVQAAKLQSPFLRNIRDAAASPKPTSYYTTPPKPPGVLTRWMQGPHQGTRAAGLGTLRGAVVGAASSPGSPVVGAVRGAVTGAAESMPEAIGAGLVRRGAWDVIGPLKSNVTLRGINSVQKPSVGGRVFDNFAKSMDPYYGEAFSIGRDIASAGKSSSPLVRNLSGRANDVLRHHVKSPRELMNSFFNAFRKET